MTDLIRKIAYRLSRSDILFWTLPVLMVLLIVGTLAQKDLGIYAAQKTYFSSLITFIGPVPFPGGALAMGVLFVNMLMKFLLFSEWRWRKSGVILTHFGVLVLLTGGLVTAFTTREGYLLIEQGTSSHKIEDYYQRMLTVTEDGRAVYRLPHQDLKPGLTLQGPGFPFRIDIETYCFNCAIERRADPAGWQGPGRFMKLTRAKQVPQNEENLTGIEFKITGTEADGHYVTFDKFPKPPTFPVGGHTYRISIERAARDLPFSLRLNKFTQNLYPGSATARSYRSDVTVTDGKNNWPTAIEMNHPLRYKGYTLYQSSFDQSGGETYTVLNVVENAGRLFPYAASLIIAAGLCLHMIVRLRQRSAE